MRCGRTGGRKMMASTQRRDVRFFAGTFLVRTLRTTAAIVASAALLLLLASGDAVHAGDGTSKPRTSNWTQFSVKGSISNPNEFFRQSSSMVSAPIWGYSVGKAFRRKCFCALRTPPIVRGWTQLGAICGNWQTVKEPSLTRACESR